LAQSLVILCHFNNRTDLIPSFIKSFFAADLLAESRNEYELRDGMAARIFSPFANLVGTEFMADALNPLAGEAQTIPENLQSNSTQLMDYVAKFLGFIISSIPLIPFPVWDICHHIFISVHKSRGPSVVAAFLFGRFFCPAVRSPDAYCDISELTKKQRKSFVLIAEMLAKIAQVDKSSSDSEEFAFFTKKERDKLLRTLELWMTRPASVPPPPQPPDAPLPWSIMEEALRYLHETLVDNMAALTSKLADKGVTCTMTYSLYEIVESLVNLSVERRSSF